METTELLKRVRKIEIKTRGLSRNVFAGEYHSAFKGRGMSFSEVREYQYGDDIRNIDWNVTARFNHPYIKIYEEERELTVMLLVDVSNSRVFGSQTQLKKNLITELSAVLSFSAIQNNDKIGVILFSDGIEKFIPPKKGRKHILRIIRELIEFTPQSSRTDISESLKYLTNAIKKRCTAFVISDFFDQDPDTYRMNYEESLRIANNKHDIIGLQIYDKRETELPPVGLIKMRDAETGEYVWVDSSSKKIRKAFHHWWNTTSQNIKTTFSQAGVDYTSIATDEDYVKPLIGLFKRR
ncbi:MAG: DUF58 domain-containing protein [Bacteroidales bacterium]|nr:DUF58 domain-containing protein [Bacteroidales bacterium]MBS3776263.1 DUF58 domain-containing protein [Bacteroidales bacterium]